MHTFPDRFEGEYNWSSERDARAILGIENDELVSVKLRPISVDGWNAYVYENEYETMWSILGQGLKRGKVGESWRRPDNAGLYHAKDGDFLVAEHETGPEWIVVIGLITASLSFSKELVGFIKTMIETVSKHVELKKAAGEKVTGSTPSVPGERYYGADGVSVEIRTKRGGKRIAAFELAPGTQISEEELLSALKLGLRSIHQGGP